MNQKESNKALETLKSELMSSEDTLVKNALKNLDRDGDITVVPVLIAAYAHRETDAIKTQIGEILGSLKLSGVENVFIEALETEDLRHIRRDLVSFMWHAGTQPNEHLTLLSRIAAEDDFLTTIEVFTLIDSLDGPFEESDLLEAMIEIREFLEESQDNDKSALMKSILSSLVSFEKSI